MFSNVDYTVTLYMGCGHGCVYCWSKLLVSSNMEPSLRLANLDEKLNVRDCVVFVNSASDWLGPSIPDDWVESLLEWIKIQDPSIKFYLQSKNPERMFRFYRYLNDVKDRVMLGTTIETDLQWITQRISRSPTPTNRATALSVFKQRGFTTRLSLEPLFKFNAINVAYFINIIEPEAVMVGLDNYAHKHGAKIQQPTKEEYLKLKKLVLDTPFAKPQWIEKDSIKKWLESNERSR